MWTANKGSDELTNQEIVYNHLESKEIYPTSVIFTHEYGGVLSISFLLDENLDEFLEVIKYKYKCDKTGYEILRDTKTILITGTAIIDYLWKISKS